METTTTAPALSPAVTAYALEAGIDILTLTSASAWGYYLTFNPWYDLDENRTVGPFVTGPALINELASRTHNMDRNIAIVARFPAGTSYAYGLYSGNGHYSD